MLTRLSFLLLGLVTVICIGCEQNTRRQSQLGARNKTVIDSLITRAQVQQFVRRQGVDCYRFVLSDSLDQSCARIQVCRTLEGYRSWVKADFDGDGRTDLLVTGRDSEHFVRDRNIICFLNKRQFGLQQIWLSDDGHYCAVAQVGYLKNRAIIRYAYVPFNRLRRLRTSKSPQLVCQADTLVFQEPGFIEYNRAPKDYQIQHVSFHTEACYGSCPIFDLHLSRSGAATYRAEEYNERKGTFTATVDMKTVNKLWALLNYVDFPRLEEKYEVGVTDNPTSTLTITYANGKVKTIEDYGEQGTFGLRQVYDLLFALRSSQAWK